MWKRLAEERGATQIEYGLIALLTSIVAILLLMVIGFDILELMDVVEDLTGVGDNGTEVPDPPRDDDI
jgi:Flp pilus assembly pilin Flp